MCSDSSGYNGCILHEEVYLYVKRFKNKFPDGQHRGLVVGDVEETEKEFDPRHAEQPPAGVDRSENRHHARQGCQRLRDGQPPRQREHGTKQVRLDGQGRWVDRPLLRVPASIEGRTYR